MAKEWILNSAMNRFQFNFKRKVGAVSAAIRKCSPKNIKEWEDYYYKNVRSKEYIEELGKKLYVKITDPESFLLFALLSSTFPLVVSPSNPDFGSFKDIFG